MAKKKRLRLSTPEEVRRALARINNMVLNGELAPKEANTLIYGCNTILGAIKTVDYEQKLLELERILAERD